MNKLRTYCFAAALAITASNNCSLVVSQTPTFQPHQPQIVVDPTVFNSMMTTIQEQNFKTIQTALGLDNNVPSLFGSLFGATLKTLAPIAIIYALSKFKSSNLKDQLPKSVNPFIEKFNTHINEIEDYHNKGEMPKTWQTSITTNMVNSCLIDLPIYHFSSAIFGDTFGSFIGTILLTLRMRNIVNTLHTKIAEVKYPETISKDNAGLLEKLSVLPSYVKSIFAAAVTKHDSDKKLNHSLKNDARIFSSNTYINSARKFLFADTQG